ncbi:MAG: DUF3369 domain-containing protein [Magnetococcales bacterium]|nr:DUF3369 domain-containing protein [Magnetococcales bacterium]MBF0437556.1 DUF3369 domain-containing protein [Magnetococcales bacterium]
MNHNDTHSDLDNEKLVFADDVPASEPVKPQPTSHHNRPPWKVIAVDDDEYVLVLTKFILAEFTFEERPIELLLGHSGEEAIRLVKEHPDAAILLLDVVMETASSGLDVVRHVRDVLKNTLIRIILRTGQPGHAPEETVFIDYDINDYKDKSTLSKQSLIISIIAALRSYRDLRTLENTRRGLEKIIDATANLFEPNSLKLLASGILTQLASIIDLEQSGHQHTTSSIAFSDRRGEMLVYAGSGRFKRAINKPLKQILSQALYQRIQEGMTEKKSLFFENYYFGYFCSTPQIENYILTEAAHNLDDTEKNLIDLFSSNISFSFNNLFLNREILNTQREVTFTLGEVIEVRSQEAGQHVRRVALYSRLLASKFGMDDNEAELLYVASPLHDLGKIGIPDTILNKPGKLTPEERATMEQHPNIGHAILKQSQRSILQAGAIIAHQHHEKWDGSGYPQGLSQENIHIFARVTAVADVFDALICDRCYRRAWEMDRVLALFKEERGKHFDPRLVDIFFENLDEIIEIKNSLQD